MIKGNAKIKIEYGTDDIKPSERKIWWLLYWKSDIIWRK